jgi:hypothetical protein
VDIASGDAQDVQDSDKSPMSAFGRAGGSAELNPRFFINQKTALANWRAENERAI